MKDDTYNEMHIQTALLMQKYSKANRAKVGAVLVTSNGVILPSYNGTPAGDDNTCEDDNNTTKPTVIHAELNCVLKAAREGISILGCTIYTTLSPCLSCSAMLAQAGVKRVFYLTDYRDMSSIHYLKSLGVEVKKLRLK